MNNQSSLQSWQTFSFPMEWRRMVSTGGPVSRLVENMEAAVHLVLRLKDTCHRVLRAAEAAYVARRWDGDHSSERSDTRPEGKMTEKRGQQQKTKSTNEKKKILQEAKAE